MGQNLLSKIVTDIIERHGLTLEMFDFGGVDDVTYYGVGPESLDRVWLAIFDKINHMRPATMGILLWQANDTVRDNIQRSTGYALTTGRSELHGLVAGILERRVFWHLWDGLLAEREAEAKLAKRIADAEA